jgi:hypothetical protein
MPTFTRHDIDTMGFKAVDGFKRGEPLHDTLVKMAKDNRMNPEQIKRLVESANTSTFLDQFKSKTGNQRMVEFDVADPSRVIQDSLGGEPSNSSSTGPSVSITISVDPVSGLHDSITDENSAHSAMGSTEEPTSQKVASLDLRYEGPKEIPMNPNTRAQVRESLLTKIADCNYRAEDLASAVAVEYRGIYTRPKYASLETDALSRYGNAAIPALQMVRHKLGMSKIARSLTAGEEFLLADRHIVENSYSLEKISSILDLAKQLNSFQRGLQSLELER